ncbi:putative structural protein [Pseudomonas phage tabernarius]|uniref:Putative structural protein n=1 Tax=Pseudomonas phage tabernarius TaxID=2048978 RepID=A0A2H4P6T1_9CAUD|nr:baseplate wedge subunit [Pseudomonas phage tabernarius]ATW57893.1 putative structural protein [Pseudomonas phage tabernarius]
MTTSTLQIDSNNDLYLPDGRNLVLLTGTEAVVQDVRCATLMRKGEDVYDVLSGVDYLGYIFTPQPSYDNARRSLISNIESSPDVLTVESLTMTVTENTLTYEAKIRTTYGQIAIGN